MTFINFTNHPSNKWGEAQLKAAQKFGKVVDVSFPNVPAGATEDEIITLAEECVDKICNNNPAAVLCQGEFTLAFNVVTRLKEKGIITVAACSERKVTETTDSNGVATKNVTFEFVQFRKF